MTRNGVVAIDFQALGALCVFRQRITMGEHEARHAIGQRRLADALRTADQPGMRNASAAVGSQQRGLSLAMPEQSGGFARMWDNNLRLGAFDLASAHEVAATLPALLVKKRSRSVIQILVATALGSGVASISTQRSGLAAAISR